MNTIKVKIRYNPSHFVTQIITGFLILQEKKIISLEFSNLPDIKIELMNSRSLLVTINEKIVVFDEDDNYTNKSKEEYNTLLSKIDFYFKRSYSIEENNKFIDRKYHNKIYSFGLNYFVSHPYFEKSNKKKYKRILSKLLYKVPFLNKATHLFYYPSLYEDRGRLKRSYIIFYTRLWDPNKETWMDKKTCNQINKCRIEMVKELRRKYGRKYKGGIMPDDFSKQFCPELVAPAKETNNRVYLKKVQRALICVNSLGLSKSTSWKVGEYVSFGKAFVQEKLFYTQIEGFREGNNYLEFSTIDECLKQIDFLLSNRDVIRKMEKNNISYYKNFLRPNKLIMSVIEKVIH